MKRVLIAAAVAGAALLASVAPSSAVSYSNTTTSTFLGDFGAAEGRFATETFDNNNVNASASTADGSFVNRYSFELTSLASLDITSVTNNQPLIDSWSMQLFRVGSTTAVGTAALTPLYDEDPETGEYVPYSQQLRMISRNLAAGIYELVVRGSVTGLATSYSGTMNLTFATPLPGALLLMGTVLLGGAGVARWRRPQSRLSV